MARNPKLRFPRIRDVARELLAINREIEGAPEDADNGGGVDVRLCVQDDGSWLVLFGDASYDQDHRGYWGASSVPGSKNGRPKRFRSRDIARSLLDQVIEEYAIARMEEGSCNG